MTKPGTWKTVAVVLALYAATGIAAPAQTFTTLLSFDVTNGATPTATLAQGTDGELYGTTGFGGAEGWGTVFKVAPGRLTTLHNFDTNDGAYPRGLVLATDANFYGETTNGGTYGQGTVFKMTPRGTLTMLHSFEGSDGSGPVAGLVQATDGNFYGTTCRGGAYNDGTIFKITPPGTLTTLHSFNFSDGSCPYARLVQATDGNFYGTTSDGGVGGCQDTGGVGCGTMFRMTPAGELTTLHNFCPLNTCTDGRQPLAELVQAADGNFYGTTSWGGDLASCEGLGCGTVFQVTPTGTFTTLHSFHYDDGAYPEGRLVQGTDGNFYGTTSEGGIYAYGSIFRTTSTGSLTTLHNFDDGDGAYPEDGGLVQATNGIFYGTTIKGGFLSCDLAGQGCGTVFSLSMGLGPLVKLERYTGKIGQTGFVLGQGFTGTTGVSINGTPASFTVRSDTFLTATVPAGATSGFVTVATPSGTLTSDKVFRVTP